MESFPKEAGTASILTKAAIAGGHCVTNCDDHDYRF